MTPSAKITYLDGIRLYRAIVAGIRQVISKQEYLNNINVFPVPDRDTGTNMALTLNSILESTYSHHDANIHVLLDTIANAALNGARGNSGAILAQFFQGFSEGAKAINEKMTTQNFVAAVTTAVNFAHRALSQPKEGTILTVIRDFSDEITHRQLTNAAFDFVDLLSLGIRRAEKSLQHTTFQLKELKKAGVVDAGAQGFVEFLNGIYHFILTGSIKQLKEELNDIDIIAPTETTTHDIDERFRYCTECLIKKKSNRDIDQDELRQKLDEMGNSLIVAGSKHKTKIHIHTNDPNKIFDMCRQYGDLSGEKADDMIHQQKSFANRKNKVAILTDSSADLPESIISQLHIHVVPIPINFGNQTFLDKISITPTEFHEALKNNAVHPTTSQPSFGDFHRQYQYLGTHYHDIIALHIPEKLSGTFSTSKKAAEKLSTQNHITVLETASTSAGQGLIVMYAAEAAQAGLAVEKIVELVRKIIPVTYFFTAIIELDYLIRGGRLSVKLKRVLTFFGLVPIITLIPPGIVKLSTLVWGKKKLAEKMFRVLQKKMDTQKQYRISIVHADCESDAMQLATLIKNTFSNIDKLFILPCCASLAVHAGPGALGFAIQEYLPY